ncbi:MAG: hypothetical protein Q9162_007936 [Coniocarpon cinnabarinum]
MPFHPRQFFPLSAALPRSYYLGHHAQALQEIKQRISRIDFVLEVRDYRIPLTSHNPLLDEALRHHGVRPKRVVVFTKRDVGNAAGRELGLKFEDGSRHLKKYLNQHVRKTDDTLIEAVRGESHATAIQGSDCGGNQARALNLTAGSADDVFFFHPTSPATPSYHQLWKSQHSPSALLRLIAKHLGSHFSITGTNVLVAGIPNVGKSTLLNALRSAGRHLGDGSQNRRHTKVKTPKVAKVSGEAGVTRKVGQPVRILDGLEVDALAGLKHTTVNSPKEIQNGPETLANTRQEAQNGPVFVMDSPGVFQPFVPDGESMLKLALCGCVKEALIPYSVLADYLIYRMNLITRSLEGHENAEQVADEIKQPRNTTAMLTTGRHGYLALINSWACRELGDREWKQRLIGSDAYDERETSPGPTNNVWHYLRWLALATGKLEKGGKPNYEAAAMYFVQKWRAGECGRFLLDEIDQETRRLRRSSGVRMVKHGEEDAEEGKLPVSASQARKAYIAMRKMKAQNAEG